MQFAKPGKNCVNCACRETFPTQMKSGEIPLSFVIPFVMHKCPHCTSRFWRLDLRKLLIMGTLVIVTVGIVLALLRHEVEI
jgi:hypothetical protein